MSPAASPDRELAAIRAVLRALGPVPGSGVFASALMRLYLRRHRDAVAVNVLGSTLLLDPMDEVERILLFQPWLWDHEEVRFVRGRLSPGDIFLDVGAHVGFYATIAARCVGPSGRVLAVEADPRTFAKLAYAARSSPAITAVNAGVADAEGVLPLSRNRVSNAGGNSFIVQYPDAETELVPCHTLLSLCVANGIDRIDGMKLDIEGFEFRVMRKFLEEAPPTMLPSFVLAEHYENVEHLTGGSVVALLEAHGYRLHAKHELNHILVR